MREVDSLSDIRPVYNGYIKQKAQDAFIAGTNDSTRFINMVQKGLFFEINNIFFSFDRVRGYWEASNATYVQVVVVDNIQKTPKMFRLLEKQKKGIFKKEYKVTKNPMRNILVIDESDLQSIIDVTVNRNLEFKDLYKFWDVYNQQTSGRVLDEYVLDDGDKNE